MAIQHNIAEGTSQYGIAFNNAYWRIATASISRQRDDPKFSVMIDLALTPPQAQQMTPETLRSLGFTQT